MLKHNKLAAMSENDLIKNNLIMWEGLTSVTKSDLNKINSSAYELKLLVGKKLKIINSLSENPPGTCFLCEITVRKMKEIIEEKKAEGEDCYYDEDRDLCDLCPMFGKWKKANGKLNETCHINNNYDISDTYYDLFQYATINKDLSKVKYFSQKLLDNMKEVLC